MVGAVKTKPTRSLNKGEQSVLLPGATGAEPWELWILGGPNGAECVQMCASPLDNRVRGVRGLALPIAQVYCLPLWLNETDSKQFAGIIPLQLELRGLKPRGTESMIFDWSIVAQEGTRTLVAVGVLPASLPEEVQTENYATFDLSARYLPLPENALMLWQEQDRLVMAITRGAHLIYFQTLPEARITQRVLQDLYCAWVTMDMEGVLTPLQQVVLWTEINPAELAALRSTFQLPITQSERPAPRPPGAAWKLTPPVVSEARKARENRRWRNRIIAIVLTVYLALVAFAVFNYFNKVHTVQQLTRWQADHTQDIAMVHSTTAAWQDLQPAVDKKSYPLELLLAVNKSIPADLHLTVFRMNYDNIEVRGEAKNPTIAYQFKDALEKNLDLKNFTWDMAQPTIAPNDLAKFTIHGARSAPR